MNARHWGVSQPEQQAKMLFLYCRSAWSCCVLVYDWKQSVLHNKAAGQHCVLPAFRHMECVYARAHKRQVHKKQSLYQTHLHYGWTYCWVLTYTLTGSKLTQQSTDYVGCTKVHPKMRSRTNCAAVQISNRPALVCWHVRICTTCIKYWHKPLPDICDWTIISWSSFSRFTL